MKLTILGCGPAGLLAAHAAIRRGIIPTIYSIPNRSEMPGAMYLHRAIPDINDKEPDGIISFRKWGTRSGYAQKVYGNPHAKCSWDKFEEGLAPAWSMSDMYDKLWVAYNGLIVSRTVSPWNVEDIVQESNRVISTIPAPHLCRKPYHNFDSTRIYVTHDAPPAVFAGEIVYNGDPQYSWYRSSNIFGSRCTEFGSVSGTDLPPYVTSTDGLVDIGIKPISTDCDCWTDRILKVGRFGAWEKGQLIHHAFEATDSLLEERERALY